MKLAFRLILFMCPFLAFQVSSDSDLINQSCTKASKSDPNIKFDFCVASLIEGISKNSSSPSTIEELLALSIRITKSNATNIVSIISNNLLKDPKFSDFAKECLQDCSELYSDSLSDLDDVINAFEARDFVRASSKISGVMSGSVTCEDQFKDGNEKSPLTEDNKIYFELNAMSLAFIQMQK